MKPLITFLFVVFLLGTACTKEVAQTTPAPNNSQVITDSATMEAPLRRSLVEQQARY
jgi:hypothetical protein